MLRQWSPIYVLSVALLILCACGTPEPDQSAAPTPNKPEPAAESVPQFSGATYVKDTQCGVCHIMQVQDWTGSHHDRAMEVASDDTVLGDFNDTTFDYYGMETRFYKRDGKFYVHTQGADGEHAEFEIAYTFGVEPLQQYLIPFPDGKMQCLSIAWDTEKKRWFHLYPDENITHDDPLHWTGRYQNWNVMCADCHSTNLKKNYNLAKDSYQTTWSELNVGCQACHGPGSEHLGWAQAKMRGESTPEDDGYGLVVDYANNDAHYQVESCAPCHARRHPITLERDPGGRLLAQFVPALLRDELYHPDGQILDEVYVYGSFVQSKMHRQGVRCTNCHNPHTLQLNAPGNLLCAQCHQDVQLPQFPTLKPMNYDTPEHHFHEPGSAGAQCVACHMPERTYMQVDPRRDHSFTVPRPDLTVKLGVPNACNTCHDDKNASWAAEHAAEWYGLPDATGPSSAEIIAASRMRDPAAGPFLAALAKDTENAAIVRATALELLTPYGPDAADAVKDLVRDLDPLVRSQATRTMEALPPETRVALLMPRLTDPQRVVRIEAARALASVPDSGFEPEQRAAFDAALAEYVDAQLASADMPHAHLNLAVMYSLRGDYAKAEETYLTALRLDPSFVPARLNLANLYNEMQQNERAIAVLREGAGRAPNEGELYYSLGLVLAEQQQLEASAESLGKAAELLADRPRVQYNYGLALQHLGRRPEAAEVFKRALTLSPTEPPFIEALAIVYIQLGDLETARTYALKLIEAVPNAPGPAQLLQQIDAQLAAGLVP
jgi:predicted CXXCH cytochrome family protein